MSGDLRKYLVFGDTMQSENSFLHAEILLQQDATALSQTANQWVKFYYSQLGDQRVRIDSFVSAYPFLKDESQWYREHSRYNIVSRFRDLNNDLDKMVRDSSQGYYQLLRFLNNSVLGCDSGNIFIAHANNVTDTSSLMISKLRYDKRKITLEWTTRVSGIYFDPDKGILSNPMKDVFKFGNPEFRFEQYGLSGNMLCGIKMLFAFGIDTRNGKLMWKEKL